MSDYSEKVLECEKVRYLYFLCIGLGCVKDVVG